MDKRRGCWEIKSLFADTPFERRREKEEQKRYYIYIT